jgi:hypothetical protein
MDCVIAKLFSGLKVSMYFVSFSDLHSPITFVIVLVLLGRVQVCHK